MNKEAFGSIQVGRTRTGKTTFTKKIVKNIFENDMNREIYIHDINAEYNDYYTEKFISDIQMFMLKIKDVENSFILIEEASIFFQNRETNKELKEMLVRKRHTNNIIYLNFHSFAMIPTYIYHLIDYVTVFKTNDNSKQVGRKFEHEKLLKTIDLVNNDKDNFKFKTISLY